MEALTACEQTTVDLALRGLPNPAIAAMRGVSLSTVQNQLTAAYRKLRVASRRELRALRPSLPAHGLEEPVRTRGLTLREQEVLGLAERGNANKVIAAATGNALSTVSTLLTRARRKRASAL